MLMIMLRTIIEFFVLFVRIIFRIILCIMFVVFILDCSYSCSN